MRSFYRISESNNDEMNKTFKNYHIFENVKCPNLGFFAVICLIISSAVGLINKCINNNTRKIELQESMMKQDPNTYLSNKLNSCEVKIKSISNIGKFDCSENVCHSIIDIARTE